MIIEEGIMVTVDIMGMSCRKYGVVALLKVEDVHGAHKYDGERAVFRRSKL
jgi:hypothetical protein